MKHVFAEYASMGEHDRRQTRGCIRTSVGGMICVLAMMCAGCGSIINGTTQKIPITVDPANATVTATGGDLSITDQAPCTLTLKRKHNHAITIESPGYKTQTVQVQSVLSGAVAGNIIAGGLIGWGVDAASGGDSKLVPEAISVRLEPNEALVQQSGPTVQRAQALEEDLQKIEALFAAGSISEEERQALRAKVLARY